MENKDIRRTPAEERRTYLAALEREKQGYVQKVELAQDEDDLSDDERARRVSRYVKRLKAVDAEIARVKGGGTRRAA